MKLYISLQLPEFTGWDYMDNFNIEYGQKAGVIWDTLNKYGALSETTLLKNTKLPENEFFPAIGWLARENKICKTRNRYELKDTNLTPVIGENAGKVWKALYNHKDIDIRFIAKEANLKIRDAYTALGWLAREDKIIVKGNNPIKFTIK
jgi:hypothetical protein